ncbi:CmNV_081-like protein [Aratus pisonii nudivirus]|nr:CmNV_081-like protein [Aratus pisonii nudivirus]
MIVCNPTFFCDNIKKYFSVSFMEYIQKHLEDKVIHIYYGSNLMKHNKQWVVYPYEINHFKESHIIDNIENLMLFTFLKDVNFIIYNGTKRYMNFDNLNITVIKLY